MNCRQFVDFILAYLEDELPGEQRRVFDAHTQECPECLDYLDSYRRTVELEGLCREPEGPVPEEVPESLVQAILAARSTKS